MTDTLERICEAEKLLVADAPNKLTELWKTDMSTHCAYAIEHEGHKVILLHECLEGIVRQSILAHEIGHHVLGHLQLARQGFEVGQSETQANTFAAAMMALILFHEYSAKGTDAKV